MVDKPTYIPARGDLVWINFNPQAGHEQAGRRPALIISPKNYNGKVKKAILCPVTNQKKGYPFEVELPKNLKVSGVVLADHVKNLDWKVRQAEYICTLGEEQVYKVMAKLNTLIGIEY